MHSHYQIFRQTTQTKLPARQGVKSRYWGQSEGSVSTLVDGGEDVMKYLLGEGKGVIGV